ncbi:MAG: hypothetical protein JW785_03915 [Acidimicrobiia bacterium]|nr:hypothetical protein [Acidimicrobiia bacterium]
MTRHPFDALSAFFGIAFTGAALLVLLADDALLGWNARWVWPAGALLLGVLLLLSGWRRTGRRGEGS